MLKPIAAPPGRLVRSRLPAAPDAGRLTRLLDRRSIGIVTAVCCDCVANAKNEGLQSHLRQAMAQVGDDRTVVVETLVTAQQHLRRFQAQADEGQLSLIGHVVALFETYGLAIFPLLLINGRIAFYGGVPDVEVLKASLTKPPSP
ncbi:MAG: hypothetical protein R3E94_08505 [Burkholderiaceae bacterium]